ncbi:hypothetical protein FIBSPDRAFT_935907 [Athelia psychrophila]|uniref:Uncharacterized protein n=1 Tax=Athelia psychrophila TaxID=1759441 RepID=A0A166CZR2_9AGAM|nr:hypothetical protein FIBSPDRAFT_935907 [Fibularhizoctonia sp. CBS 109695]
MGKGCQNGKVRRAENRFSLTAKSLRKRLKSGAVRLPGSDLHLEITTDLISWKHEIGVLAPGTSLDQPWLSGDVARQPIKAVVLKSEDGEAGRAERQRTFVMLAAPDGHKNYTETPGLLCTPPVQYPADSRGTDPRPLETRGRGRYTEVSGRSEAYSSATMSPAQLKSYAFASSVLFLYPTTSRARGAAAAIHFEARFRGPRLSLLPPETRVSPRLSRAISGGPKTIRWSFRGFYPCSRPPGHPPSRQKLKELEYERKLVAQDSEHTTRAPDAKRRLLT